MKQLLGTVAALMLGTFAIHAETAMTILNGDIGVEGNWTNGLPLIGNQGTVSIDANRASDVDINGWDLVINGGTLTDDVGGFSTRELKGGSVFDIQTGGTYIRTNATYGNALRIHGGSTLKVSGGTAIMSGFAAVGTQAGGFTIDVSGGSLWSAKVINFNNGVNPSTINVSGGTLEFGDADVRNIDEPNTFFNISGGSLIYSKLDYATMANDTNIVVTISNDGALITHIYDNAGASAAADRYINFATDNLSASWTWTGKAEADFIAMWNADTLRHNGLSGADGEFFSDHFAVSGDTISPLVAPATTTLKSSGAWSTAANWTAGVPTVATPANVNSNLTADLSGGAGSAKRLGVGILSGQSGTVQNGSLNVAEAVLIATKSGAAGTLNLTSLTGGLPTVDLPIGTGTSANGSLTATTVTLDAANVDIATGSNSVGTISFSSGSITAVGDVNIATGQDSSVTGAAGTDFVLASTNNLSVGTGLGATHDLTAGNFSITGPIGDVVVGAGTGSSVKGLIAASDSIGSVTANSSLDFTAGHHDITDLIVAGEAGSSAAVSGSGSTTATVGGKLNIAWAENATGSLDLSGITSGSVTVGVINVARDVGAVGSLTYTNGNLHQTGAMEVGAGGDYASATVNLKSLSGGSTLSIAQSTASLNSVGTTATVTVAESAFVGTVRVARSEGSVGTLIVGDTLEVRANYLNAAGYRSNAVGVISADTIIKTNNTSNASGIQVAFEQNCDGRITANDGELVASSLTVSTGPDSYGIFAITNGTLELLTGEALSIAEGSNSTAHVLVAITSTETNNVRIGMGAGATGSLTMPGGALVTTDLQVGTGSYIDITGDTASITWPGGDFEALWDAGQLRRDGLTGPTYTFSDYFDVTDGVLTPTSVTPPGIIDIALDPGGVAISWTGVAGQTYKVWSKDNLLAVSWTLESTQAGVDGPMSVVLPTTDPATFYQVTAE